MARSTRFPRSKLSELGKDALHSPDSGLRGAHLPAQLELRDLARAGLRQLVQEGDRFGRLEAGERSLTKVDELLARRPRPPGCELTNASGRSPHFSSGTPTTAASSTAGWREERLLDLDGGDVLPAGDDHVLGAVAELT